MIRLLVNGTVLTQDDSRPVAQALAVKDGRIVEVGGADEILWLREDEYELIDQPSFIWDGGRTPSPEYPLECDPGAIKPGAHRPHEPGPGGFLAAHGDGLHEGMTFSLNSYPMTFSCSTGTFLVRP